ncbi:MULTISPECIES: ABC transporter permease [Fischerella]|uniref:ABC transporter permease n=1 Tax=Fischerella TaxID=1190 RepID=UPI0003110A18|nr:MULTISPECIES: ABC transporter permease [Fischerella]MBD2433209.1 ABC transporter permease [Fischerella sp. FACHB-380]
MSGPFSERSSLKTKVFGGFSATIAHSLNVLHRRERSPLVFLFSSKGFRRVLSLVLFFSIWQFLCTIKFNFFVNFALIPSPLEVLGATIEFFSSNPMLHIWSSTVRVLSGFAIAALVGISLGIFIGWFQQIEDLIFPPLELLRPIPAVAWIPLAILMFPSSESGMIYITFIGAFFPILISTMRGVENTDLLLLRVGQCLGAKQWHLFKDIVVPGAMPSIASGLVIGMGNAWFCLVTAEILAGRYGIGYLTWESYVTSNYPPIVMGMLLIGLMGASSTYAVDRLTRLLMPWRVTKKQSL